MNQRLQMFFSLFLVAAFSIGGIATAGKPVDSNGDFIGNGFPSGPHFNLLIHGKDPATFTCPEEKFYQQVTIDGDLTDDIIVGDLVETCPAGYTCATTTEVIYGNVINVPRDGSEVQILVESGRKGPKSKPDATTLEVVDACTRPFDDDAAVFRLPADPDGYAVYSRVTGKPSDSQAFQVTGRDLELVELLTNPDCDPTVDSCETTDLLLLGVVTEDGVFVPSSPDTFERVDNTDGRGGKGVKNAVEITNLFEFSGSVCYLYGDDPACTSDPDASCAETAYCCPTDPSTGAYTGECALKSDPLFYDAILMGQSCDVADEEGVVDWVDLTLYCRDYTDSWIFNIADFVNVLYRLRNDETYNVQLRFYPLPLQDSARVK